MARQAGVGQARCDVIAVMDSHVEVAEGKLHVQCVSYIAVCSAHGLHFFTLGETSSCCYVKA